jgi:hypothetical protein
MLLGVCFRAHRSDKFSYACLNELAHWLETVVRELINAERRVIEAVAELESAFALSVGTKPCAFQPKAVREGQKLPFALRSVVDAADVQEEGRVLAARFRKVLPALRLQADTARKRQDVGREEGILSILDTDADHAKLDDAAHITLPAS